MSARGLRVTVGPGFERLADRAAAADRATVAGRAAALAAAEAVLARARTLAPRRSGALQASGRVEADGLTARAVFDAPYAGIQESQTGFKHENGGQARFLATAAADPAAMRALRAAFASEMERQG